MRIFTILFLTILLLVLVGFSQDQKEGDFTKINSAKLYDAPVGPVKLTAKEYAATLCNTAQVQLTQYRIGCVEKKDDKIEIVRKDALVDDHIDGPGGCLTLETTHKVFPFDECAKGKLAVIEVVFADGTRWALQP